MYDPNHQPVCIDRWINIRATFICRAAGVLFACMIFASLYQPSKTLTLECLLLAG